MRLTLEPALPADAAAIAALGTAVADRLTQDFGKGHWSSAASERGILAAMRRGTFFVARRRGRIIASLALSTRKPWAIDRSYFTPVARPLYLTAMAVEPNLQRRGIGRRCMAEVTRLARAWPADAVRLDAYAADSGAGRFYAKCGYRERGRATYRQSPLIYFELVF